ncbi:hypothetical protein SAMN04488688_10778 [Paenibacillus sp. cl141a]|nr:hypothetical protein SAMN04488688_10778 [Paenibacillus sp. cl141a]
MIPMKVAILAAFLFYWYKTLSRLHKGQEPEPITD